MNSHLSKTEYRIMEYFWSTGGKYTFGELMKYFNEEEDKNWKKQTLNTFLSRLIDKGLLERKKEETKAYYGAALTKAGKAVTEAKPGLMINKLPTKAEFKQRKAKAILEECYEGKISHFIAALTGNNAITKVDEKELIAHILDR